MWWLTSWINASKFSCFVLFPSAAKSSPFFLYYAFQHIHYPQFAGRHFRNSTIRGTYGDSIVSNHNIQFMSCMILFHNESDAGISSIVNVVQEVHTYCDLLMNFLSCSMRLTVQWARSSKLWNPLKIQNNTFVFLTADNGYVYCSPSYSQSMCLQLEG